MTDPQTDTVAPIVLDVTGADIAGEAARLREHGPIVPVTLPGGVRAWSITDYTILRELLANPLISKDPHQHWPAFINGEIPADWPLALWVSVRNMFTAYGTEHRRLRKLVAPAFTNRRTQIMKPRIEALVTELLDALAERPADAAVDIRAAYAEPLPIRVITELMGVPHDLQPPLRVCVDELFSGTPTRDAVENYMEFQRTLGELIARRRTEPGDDLTSALIAERDDEGDRLTEQELADTLLLMISAGFETTVNLLDQAIYILLTDPEQLAAIRTGKVTWSDVIEETLRYAPPVAHLPLRYAVADIDGTPIKQGDAVLASFAPANRDPAIHPGLPDTFDPTRTSKDHLSFGHGAHHCLGAPLARLEAEIALPALFARFPDLAFAVDPETIATNASFIANGHTHLPVYLRGR
ncbi:cytochrome P450 family protein [Nocardia sp. NPDC003345]